MVDEGTHDPESQVPGENTSRSVTVEGHALILADHGGRLFAYANRCPHTGETLDPMGGSLSDAGGSLLTCQRHGAQFLAATGECVSGPCLGEYLTPVEILAIEGTICLA